MKRIKPAAFVPYDLTREAYTRQLWAFEGFTSYYDDLALVRCGLIDARALSRAPRPHDHDGAARRRAGFTQSVADSSFDAWIKFYRQDENSPNAVVSYYAKGSLVGCALDLVLRRDGRATLDDLMRALWQRYGRTGVGVPEDGIPRLASELAGRDLSEFFARYVDGTEDPPLAELLADFGITCTCGRDRRQGSRRQARERHRAAQHLGRSRWARISAWPPCCATARPHARASPRNDVLVAIGGLKATPERIACDCSTRYAPGETVEVHAFRRDELMAFRVTLDAAPADTCYLTLDSARRRRSRRAAARGCSARP